MRRSERRAAACGRSDRTATLLGACVAAIVLAAAVLLEAFRFGPAFARLDAGSRDVAAAIGRAVAVDVERALDLGIPLDRMVAVVPYLDAIRTANPSISGLAIEDAGGATLFASPPGEVTGAPVETPLLYGGAAVGTVLVAPSAALERQIRGEVAALGGAFALLAGLVAGVVVRLWRLERIDLPEARFVAGGRAVARGVLADFSVPRAGPFTPPGQAAARLTAPVRRAHRRLLALIDEVTALDVAARYRDRIAAVHASLSGLTFDRPFRRRARERALLWWPLLALGTGGAARFLATSFAADRVAPDPAAPLAVAAAVAASAAGGLVGLGLARLLDGRMARGLAGLALLVAAIATGAVAVVRDLALFLALEAGAAAALWLAVFSLSSDPALGRRRPWLPALLLLAGLATGPVAGTLLAEAAGRRAAFLVIGVATALVALLALATNPQRRGIPPPPARLDAGEVAALAAAALGVVAWADIRLATETLREDYAGLALHAALLGTASLLPAALGLRSHAALGAALAAAALAASAFGSPPGPLVTVAIGLGLGTAVHALGARGFGPAPVAALLAGALLAAVATALPDLAPGMPAARLRGDALSAAAALVLAAVAILGSLATRVTGRRGR